MNEAYLIGRTLLWAGLLIAGSAHTSLLRAAEIELIWSCAVDGPSQKTHAEILPADEAGLTILRNLVQATGSRQNFEVFSSTVPNAEAAMSKDGRRLIMYNQNFVRTYDGEKWNWHAYGILAHEIGHHLQRHRDSGGSRISRRDEELDADWYAGYLLNRMSADLEEAKEFLASVPVKGNSDYPDRETRLAQVTNGWIQSNEVQRKALERRRSPGTGRTAIPRLAAKTASVKGSDVLRYIARCEFFRDSGTTYILTSRDDIIGILRNGRVIERVGVKKPGRAGFAWIYKTSTNQWGVTDKGQICRIDEGGEHTVIGRVERLDLAPWFTRKE